jgi:hypothetical protein
VTAHPVAGVAPDSRASGDKGPPDGVIAVGQASMRSIRAAWPSGVPGYLLLGLVRLTAIVSRWPTTTRQCLRAGSCSESRSGCTQRFEVGRARAVVALATVHGDGRRARDNHPHCGAVRDFRGRHCAAALGPRSLGRWGRHWRAALALLGTSAVVRVASPWRTRPWVNGSGSASLRADIYTRARSPVSRLQSLYRSDTVSVREG